MADGHKETEHGALRAAVGARLDRLPVGLFHYRVLILIALGTFLDAYLINSGSLVLADLLKTGWSTLEANAAFLSSTFSGIMVGAFASGVLSDRFGRRFCYHTNLLLMAAGALGGGLSPSMDWLIGWRFVMGIGMGAEFVISYATIGELMPARNRGRWIAATVLIVNIAPVVASLLALWIVPVFGWRYMFYLAAAACLVLSPVRANFVPESPRWLESKGRFVEADEVMARIEHGFGYLPPVPLIRHIAPIQQKVSILVLFAPGVWSRTAKAVLFNISYGVALYGLVGWLPSFFVHQGIDVVSSIQFTTVMMVGGPLGSILAMALVDRIGRRHCMVWGSLASAAIALAYPFMAAPNLIMATGLLLVMSIYFWVTAGVAMLPELFATEYRLRGTGFSSMIGRLITACIQFGIVAAYIWGGVLLIVGSIAALLLVQALVFWWTMTETSQQPLDALDNL